MELSPEEKRKIYEGEKERIEAEKAKQAAESGSTTSLKPNIAGLLCYVGGWITGIIFLIIEPKNKFVRFHAMQSIIVFGALTIAGSILGWIPFIGAFFAWIIWLLGVVLWIVLMIKAYQGTKYKLPWSGDLAEKWVG